jgi:amino acid adenylation domain-containing protein
MAVEGGSGRDVRETPAPSGATGPLSWFQERMWVHHQRNPESTSYSLPLLLSVRGDLDVPALEASLSLIVARHESLRTAYAMTDDGEAVQSVVAPEPVHLPVVDVDREQLLKHLDRVLEHRFDLGRGDVFLASLVRLSPGRHLLLLNVHHIAADAWSLQAVFFAELQGAYAAFCRGQRPDLPPLPVQYATYARGQRATDMSADLEYWRDTLAGYEDSLELPTRHARRRRSGTTSATHVHRYPADFALALERFAREHDCTIFMCLLAALGVTLSRYADKDDLCVGTTVSSRSAVELEPLIGFFVNILPLRLRFDEQSDVATLLGAVRRQVLDAFEHPAPYEQILRATDVARRGGGDPLVPIVMRHQNFPQTALGSPLPDGVTFTGWPEDDDTDAELRKLLARQHVPARSEMELSYIGSGGELVVEVSYASDLHDGHAVERLLAHQQQVLEGMFADAGRRLADLPMLRAVDVRELLERAGRTPVTPAPAWSFVDRFDTWAERSPDAVACWDDHRAWTFHDIARRAGQIAGALVARGIAPGDLVGVCLPRGGELLSALLGVWMAGAAYVPIDPGYPTAYARQILDDADPRVVVCRAAHQPSLDVEDPRCVRVEDIPQDADAVRAAPEHIAGPGSLAYVMYTSGSTGRPKGVRVPHRQLTNWLGALETRLPFEPGEVVAQKTTFVFAVGVKELFAGLLNGCPQVFLADTTVRDPAAFVDALAEHGVTRLNLVPSHLAGVLDHLRASGRRLPALRVCVTAGEPLPGSLVVAFRELLPGARLLNNYGCTELNDISYYDTAGFGGDAEFVPIGTPIANTTVHVLDRLGRLVPDGVAGELHVASAGMPEGYHGRDDLTAERFLPNPFGVRPDERLYNTGDVVRHLPDGTLDFIGRWDFQVKVRGFRVEVRQVEKVIGDFDGIQARAVVGQGDRLVAFHTVRPGHAVDVARLRAFLHERLPAYLVPDVFVALDAMPMLPNGKLDRRALLSLRTEQRPGDGHEPPAGATERALADIWALIVNVPVAHIGRRTHFFDIGGHSLSAMRVLARIKERFGVDVGLSELFDAPRLDTVAAVIDRRAGAVRPDPGTAPRTAVRRPRPSAGSGLLHDKVVLVTGASRGIGLATALLLAEQGARVAVNHRDSEAQARGVKETIEADGGAAEVFQADVTRADEVAAMVAAVHDRFGRIDVLVTNAHIPFRHRPFLDQEWADLDRKVSDELKAVFHPCQAVVPGMLRRRSGSIIAVSGTCSRRGDEGLLAQSTAKAAVDAFVRSLATELGPHGVRVNTVAPGLTLTDTAMPFAAHVRESAAARSPMRRNALPEDLAGAVTFLASDLSRFMTGTYLPVDGGSTML